MGSMIKSGAGELALMERIKTLKEEVEDLTTQLEQAKSDIDSLNGALEWKQLPIVTGTTPINLPTNFFELYINVRLSDVLSFSFYVVKNDLKSTMRRFHTGFCALPNSSYGICYIDVSLTKVVLQSFLISGVDEMGNCSVTVCYR